MVYISDYKYADMKNSLTNSFSIDYFQKNLQPVGLYLPSGTDLNATFNKLDELLTRVNIKRACCLQSTNPDNTSMYLTKVRLPGYHSAPIDTGLGNVYRKYNFTDYDLNIEKSLCTSAIPNGFSNPRGPQCQNFYTVYCKNIVEEFKRTGGYTDDTFNYDEFMYYKPECACFAPIPKFIKDSETNPAPFCYLPGCEPQSGVFLDPVSANPRSNCNLTICQSGIDINNIQGRNVNIKNKITQLCGARGVTVNTNPIIDQFNSIFDPIDSFFKTHIGSIADSIIPGSYNYITYVSLGTICLSICCVIIATIIIISVLFFKK